MPITKSTGYLDSSGVMHATVEEAQRAELRALWARATESLPDADAPESRERFANVAIAHTDAIIAILTTGPRSRPKARKTGGTTNPRRAAKRSGAVAPVPATPDQAKAGFEAMREATEAAA